MLLTLAASTFRASLRKDRVGPKSMRLTDLPRFTREELGLYGLNISTDLLVGADIARLDALRESADKASCPYLVLIESEPQPFCHADEDKGQAAMDRMVRVAKAAHRLGCNSAAVAVAGPDEPAALDLGAARLKKTLQAADKLEINLLLMPAKGLTASPDRLTDLIKKVGGFRIGTFPDFQAASLAEDPIHYLRRLTPYAAAVTAAVVGFKTSKKPPGAVHEPYDILAYTKTVASVGYTGTLALDYRGEGDPADGIVKAKAILEAVVGTEVLEE